MKKFIITVLLAIFYNVSFGQNTLDSIQKKEIIKQFKVDLIGEWEEFKSSPNEVKAIGINEDSLRIAMMQLPYYYSGKITFMNNGKFKTENNTEHKDYEIVKLENQNLNREGVKILLDGYPYILSINNGKLYISYFSVGYGWIIELRKK